MKAGATLALFAFQESKTLLLTRSIAVSTSERIFAINRNRNCFIRRSPPICLMSSSTPDASASTGDEINVAENLKIVQDAIQAARTKSPAPETEVRLVAVSKTKPLELLQKAYEEGGCRVFGENYVQELAEKAPLMPEDVTWHFIGALQSNKVGRLLKPFLPNQCHRLVLETVSSEKMAVKLNNAVSTNTEDAQLSIFVQVNTSGEDSKAGVEPGEELVKLCRMIVEECPSLKLQGLMTIGAVGDASDFKRLVESRNIVAEALQVEPTSLELSMGMSGDFEEAIQYGATNVRVGSTIFGARNYANKE